MCPHCGRDAPVIYRGALPYCTACNKLRAPLTSDAVHVTGKPAKVGGAIANIVAWIMLALGAAISLIVGSFFQWLFPAGIVGWAIGLSFLMMTLLISFGLMKGGSALKKSGAAAEARTVEQAVFALAEARGGILSALDVAQTIGVSEQEADQRLTQMAKLNPERVRVELDDNGTITYQFPTYMLAAPGAARAAPNARVVDFSTEEPLEEEAPGAGKRIGR